ncbi:MAG: SusC/RagA family TonB-linked outer membrane protein [Gemmatimonadaceae bacterium]
MRFGRWRLAVGPSALGAALMLLTGAARQVSAQATVTGRVTAQGTNQPLAEARVLVIGSTLSATTGDDGKFSVKNVAPGTVQLQVLRVGFQSQKRSVTVAPGVTTTADFTMSVAVAQLEEVVTTATGQQRRVELGNAVSTLGDVTKRVEETPNHNISDLLIAKSPGVTILPGTELGGAPSVRIRGVSSISLSNAPIWYVDGVRYSAGTLSSGTDVSFSMLGNLNPEDIEDIEIVKGPSAATLYGTNAANGVILITTKKGRAGATHWNWSAEQRNVQDNVPYQAMYANFGHDPVTGKAKRCELSSMVTPKFTVAQGGNCISDSLTSYNWMTDPSVTFVHPGKGSLYGLNITGGTDQVRYFVSGDADNEIGPLQMPGFDVQRFDSLHIGVRNEWFHPEAQQRSSFRGNLSASLSPKFDLTVSSGFVKQDNRIPPESDLIIALYYVGMQNYGYKGCPGGVAPCGLDKIPTQADGVPLHDALQWDPGEIMQVTQNNDVQRFTGSLNGNWRPFSWMVNDGTVGVDFATSDFFQLCRLTECPPQSSTAQLGRVSDNQAKNRNLSAKIASTSSWNARPWANLKTSVGADYTNLESDFTNTGGVTLPPGGSTVGASSTKSASDGQPSASKTLGLYVQEQASLRDRLFLTGAIRTDQNSAFGQNFQQVYYPKLGLSWILSDESFFPHPDFLNQLRLRTAYGASGVQPGATTALALFSASTVSIPVRSSTATGGTDTPALLSNQPGNANLKPEKSTELELGGESQMFGNRLHLDYTFWHKTTHDALINVSVSASSAASQLSPLVNIGATQGWGHEFQLNAQLVDRRHFGWDVLLTGSHLSNKVLDLGIDPNTGKPRTLGTGQARQIPGLPINSQWFRGYTYSDANGDGIIQKSEVAVDTAFSYFGYITPRDLISVQNGFDLFGRKLRLNMMFDYKGGNSILDGANNFQCNTGPYACRDTEDPSFSQDRQAAAIAKQFGSTINSTSYKTTVGYFRNDQFWKFREVSLVWQLPQMLYSRIRAQGGSTLVFGARNLHTWTSWTGIDPEANYGTSQSETQSEFQTTGLPTYYTVRLNLKY